MEGQLRRLAQQRLHLFRIANPRNLDQHTSRTLSLDQRLARAALVDTTTQNLDRVLQRRRQQLLLRRLRKAQLPLLLRKVFGIETPLARESLERLTRLSLFFFLLPFFLPFFLLLSLQGERDTLLFQRVAREPRRRCEQDLVVAQLLSQGKQAVFKPLLPDGFALDLQEDVYAALQVESQHNPMQQRIDERRHGIFLLLREEVAAGNERAAQQDSQDASPFPPRIEEHGSLKASRQAHREAAEGLSKASAFWQAEGSRPAQGRWSATS